MKAEGKVFRYGDNVDTDVIIPARYLNTSEKDELRKHCMEVKKITNKKREEIKNGTRNY